MREIGVQECGCDRILPRKLSHDFVATMSLGRGVLRFKILTFVWTVQQSRPHQAVHACRPRLNSITATQPRVGSQWRTGNFQPTSHSVFPAAATSDAQVFDDGFEDRTLRHKYPGFTHRRTQQISPTSNDAKGPADCAAPRWASGDGGFWNRT